MFEDYTDIMVKGNVTLTNGYKVWDEKSNHFVGSTILGTLSNMMIEYVQWYGGVGGVTYYLPSNGWTMLIGSDTETPTTASTTALTSPIINTGTEPSQKQIFTTDGSGDGVWTATYRAMWNQGTVSGTVGEVGLYLRMPTYTTSGWNVYNTNYTPSLVLASRLSVADSDISPHVIDETNPLTLDWKVTLSF